MNNETSMWPIFIAHGPAFKKNYKIESFKNVDIYPLMCFILGITPSVNNGSLENVIRMLTVNYVENGMSICKLSGNFKTEQKINQKVISLTF